MTGQSLGLTVARCGYALPAEDCGLKPYEPVPRTQRCGVATECDRVKVTYRWRRTEGGVAHLCDWRTPVKTGYCGWSWQMPQRLSWGTLAVTRTREQPGRQQAVHQPHRGPIERGA